MCQIKTKEDLKRRFLHHREMARSTKNAWHDGICRGISMALEQQNLSHLLKKWVLE